MDKRILMEREIKSQDFNRGGELSSSLKKKLKRLGICPQIIRRAAIVSYELEMNITIHSRGGLVKIMLTEEQLVINARDSGPGIKDIDRALKPGFSTADREVREMGFGAGMGLNNVKKYSDTLEINSHKGEKTEVVAEIELKATK